MRIATLQIASRLGDVEGNIKRADALLQEARVDGPEGINVSLDEAKLDILVLPELALTGYNFPSLDAIKPYVEEVGKGPSAEWARRTARRLRCKVCVGYPEIEFSTGTEGGAREEKYYNSLLVVNEEGSTLLNYRKTFLYYTDETWASEGSAELGFHQLTFPTQNQSTAPSSQTETKLPAPARAQGEAAILPPPPPSTTLEKPTAKPGKEIATSFGICMDINPYRFEAPYSAYEFAHRVLDSNSQLVILSMAWLTLLSREELDNLKGEPEMDTFNYWIQRFMPLIRQRLRFDSNADENESENENDGENGGGDGEGSRKEKKIILVFANRAGEEGTGDKLARYAGTSTVITISQRATSLSSSSTAALPDSGNADGNGGGSGSSDDGTGDNDSPLDVSLHCWAILGAATEGVCFADTRAEPEVVFKLVKPRG
ncbi:carbon-nitrogen hydrolase [Aspergillus crustosus]